MYFNIDKTLKIGYQGSSVNQSKSKNNMLVTPNCVYKCIM